MTLLSMRFSQKIAKVFAVVFLLGAVLGISWELVLAQKKVSDLGSAISRGPVPSLLEGIPRLDEIQWRLERHRVSRGFERLELFNGAGRKVAESPAGEHGKIHGVLTSARAGVRDPTSGREVAHLVVWRNMEAEMARPLLIGLIAGLLAVFIAWPVYLKKLAGEL
jgi:hypothetical protein